MSYLSELQSLNRQADELGLDNDSPKAIPVKWIGKYHAGGRDGLPKKANDQEIKMCETLNAMLETLM